MAVDGRDDVAGVGVLYAHLEGFGASGLVDGEFEAEDGEELLVDNGDGLGVNGVDANTDGCELVGGFCVVAEEGVFYVHWFSRRCGWWQWSRVRTLFVKVGKGILYAPLDYEQRE